MDNLQPPDGFQRSLSRESDASSYKDAQSTIDDDLDTDEDFLDEDIGCGSDSEPSEPMHPDLYRDMENLVLIYGEKSMEFRLFESIDQIDVELHIPVSFLEEVIAQAWRVNRTEPLIVRLHLSLSHYTEANGVPKVEVFQPSAKESFGFGNQVQKVIEAFLDTHWQNIHEDYVKCIEKEEMMKKSFTFPVANKTEECFPERCKSASDESVAKLVEIGYDANMARNALIITHDNLEEAVSLLENSPSTCLGELLPEIVCRGESKVDHTEKAENITDDTSNKMEISASDKKEEKSAKPVPHKLFRQISHPLPFFSKLKRVLPKLTRTTSMMPGLDTGGLIEDLNLMPLSTLDEKSAKTVPSLIDGFLVQIFRYVRQRIPTLNEYCVICDKQHVFQNGAMLKPTVCARELCVFAFQTLGVMADAAEDIATGAEVVDLLLNMTRFACKSGRKNIIFDPYPMIVDPTNPSSLLFSPDQKDYNRMTQVLDAVPNMNEMVCLTDQLKQTLNDKDRAIYPLLQWIITSNRSHIVKLPEEKQLKFMVTPHQFLLVSSPPAKEIAFRDAKEKHGSTFAFHGSSIENWHSIIRQGLLNASGTRLQVNGAAYGKGIYLSPHISTSMGYSRMGYGYSGAKKIATDSSNRPRFLTSDNITCIAICEVITSNKLKKNNSIWVCENPDHVCTRFFFVYENGQVGDSAINTQEQKYLNEILAACR